MGLFEPSPYEVLGLARDAGPDELDAAVEAAVDGVAEAGRGGFSVEQVEAAAQVLSDPVRRLELDVQHLPPPEPVDEAAELLGPLLDAELPFPERAEVEAGDLTAVHRRELAADFAELPPPPAGFPGVPERFQADTSVLPPFEPPR
jgi:curved DNA-binding protein CbpA